MVNPEDFEYVADEWFDDKVERTAIARSAFGNFYFWSEKYGVEQLYTQYKKVLVVSKELPFFFDYGLTQDRYIKSNLHLKLFKQALKKLGELEYDECYSLQPALALGGEEKIENLDKANLQVYLEILLQL